MSEFDKSLTWTEDALGGSVVFSIKKAIYPLDVVMGAIYWFTDQYYLFVDDKGVESDCYLVEFRFKDKESSNGLDWVISEFSNRLVDQKVRNLVSAETQMVRDIIVKRAFSEALSKEEQQCLETMK